MEPRTAFSDKRTERCEHLLAAEPARAAADSGREEPAALDEDYNNNHDRDDYHENRSADRWW